MNAATNLPSGAFDFVSVCPPYLLVSYEELYDLLDVSPLIHEVTCFLDRNLCARQVLFCSGLGVSPLIHAVCRTTLYPPCCGGLVSFHLDLDI